eukprot:4912207-Amphidinium_carterae.1
MQRSSPLRCPAGQLCVLREAIGIQAHWTGISTGHKVRSESADQAAGRVRRLGEPPTYPSPQVLETRI